MRYVPALDGIRALAMGVVLLFHAGVPVFTEGGRFGVDLFFVLSGYLITRILVDEHARTGAIDLPHFYVRRLRRLWPPLLVMLAVYLVVAPWVFGQYSNARHWWDAGFAAIYLSDYQRLFGPGTAVLDHMWSLAVEEQFYLLWPAVLLCLLRLRRSHAIAVLVGLFLAVTAWRLMAYEELGWLVYHRLDTHGSGLIVGSLIGLARWRLPAYFGWVGLVGFVVTAMSFASNKPGMVLYGFTMAEAFAAMVILSPPAGLAWRPLVWLGKMSYGFYLWHFLFTFAASAANFGWPETLAIGTLGGLGFAILSYHTVEASFRPRREARDSAAVNVSIGARS